MKKIFYVGLISFAFLSCGKDDCTTEGFLGTWTGTEKCSAGTEAPVTVVVTGSGTNLVLDGGSLLNESVKRDDCSLEGGASVFGIGTKITGNLSTDGKTLKIVSEVGVGISLLSCTFELKK
jgi:hypothetical protein